MVKQSKRQKPDDVKDKSSALRRLRKTVSPARKGTSPPDEHREAERARLLEELARQKDIISAIMENTQAMLAYLDTEFNFVAVNTPYATGSGHSVEELIGKNHFALFPNVDNEAIFKQVRDTGKPVVYHDRPFEYANQPERGVTYWDWTLTPVKDTSGGVQGLVLSLIETTERVQAEKETQKALERSRQRQLEISSLLDSAHAILEHREFARAAKEVFTICKKLIGATAGYIALLTRGGQDNEVVFLDAGGLPCTVDPALPMPVRGLRAEVYRSGKAAFDNHFRDSVWMKYLPKGHAELDNVMFAPLNIEGNTVGLLGLANKPGGFDQHDADMATAFGELAAIALKNSRTLEALETSETRFRSVFAESPYGILVNDVETLAPIDFNITLAAQLGYTREEFAKLKIADFEAMESPEEIMARTRKIMSRGADFFETKHRTKSGELRDIEVTAKLININGRPVILAIYNDVTERKRAEEKAWEYERQIECLVQSNIMGIVVANINGEVLGANDTFLNMVGYSREEMLQGKIDWIKMTPPEFRRLDEKALEELFESGSSTPYEKEYIRKDGSRVPITIGAALWSAEPSNLTWVCFVLDISRQKKAEEQLLAYERLATLGKIAGNISHELRNPLATIDSSVFFLQSKLRDSDEKIRTHLERIHSSVLRSTGIIQSLLDLTRMKEPKREKLDLKMVVSETVALSKIPSTVSVVQDFPENEVIINVDRDQLRMAFGNLINNAVQAMEWVGKLTITIRHTESQVEISFIDTGPGIAPENVGKLFQPLFSTKARGIGFGLAITKMIVERHGGTIGVESEPGKGANFTIKLPSV